MRTSAPAARASSSGGAGTYPTYPSYQSYGQSASPAAAPVQSSGRSFWQTLLDGISGDKGSSFASSWNESYANAYRASSFTVPQIAQAGSDIERMNAAAARASSVYDDAATRAYQALSQGSRPLALEASLFRLPATRPLVGPFGEQPGTGGSSLKTMLLVGGVGVAAVLGIKAWKKRKGA